MAALGDLPPVFRPAALLLAVLAVAPAAIVRADERCAVPLADWQPREALKARLERDGWSVVKIRADDGCYKVLAIGPDGVRQKTRFDPATLERVGHDEHDRHGRHGGHDDERD